MAQRPMTSFIERQVNHICGRWLDGFTKENVEVSLMQANITLSNVLLKTDELCLLSPTFAPKVVYVGKMSVDIPLAFNFARPLKITVADVMVVVKVGTDHISPEEARKAVSANVHVRNLLGALASDLGGGRGAGGDRDHGDGISEGASTVTLGTISAIQKVAQKMEITIQNAHVRLEETEAGEVAGESGVPLSEHGDTPAGSPSVRSAVAFGICLREMSLQADTRVKKGSGGGDGQESSRWIGRKCWEIESSILGNSRSSQRADAGAKTKRNGASTGATSTRTTWGLGKFASVRGLSAYFCRDEECHTPANREETLRRMRERSTDPPGALPPLLRRCRAGMGLRAVMSAEELGRIESVDARLVVGDINVQVTDDHLEYLLRWASLLRDHSRTLSVAATRPVADSVHSATAPTISGVSDANAVGVAARRKSRFYGALWKHAKEMVLRDLKVIVKRRGKQALEQGCSDQNRGGTQCFTRQSGTEGSACQRARAALWRLWFREWVSAARYLAVRELLHPHLTVGSFSDESGGVHDNLYEDLVLEPGGPGETYTSRRSGGNVPHGRELGKFLMPWQLPQEDVSKAWDLIRRRCVRWETRQAGGIRLALDEERADMELIDTAVLQALWSVQLQMDAQLPHGLCAATRCIAVVRIALRKTTDALWQARAEKQRRLGLGHDETLTTCATTATPGAASLHQQQTRWRDSGLVDGVGVVKAVGETEGESGGGSAGGDVGGGTDEDEDEEDVGDGADRVGTLLVKIGQLDGVGGVGLLSLAPKAVAKVMLEESSASVEDLEKETLYSKVARYDGTSARCTWDDTFRLQVELDQLHVLKIRKQRNRRHRPTNSPCKSGSPTVGPSRSLVDNANGTPLPNRGDGNPTNTTGSVAVTGNPTFKERTIVGVSDNDDDDNCSNINVNINNNGSNGRTKLMIDTRPAEEIGSPGCGGDKHALATADKGKEAAPLLREISPAKEKDKAMSLSSSRNSSGSTDSVSSQAAAYGPRSSFLLSVSCVDKGVFGDTQLGTVTLPSKELSAVSLKVMEHKCTLFSPDAVGREPLKLTLQTLFVPPGQDVAMCEQELRDVGKRLRLQHRQDLDLLTSRATAMLKNHSRPGRRRTPLSSPSRGVDGAVTAKPNRAGFGEVGSQELQILPAVRVPEDDMAMAAEDSRHGTPETSAHANSSDGNNQAYLSAAREIPIVDVQVPERVEVTARLSGLQAVVHLNYSAAVAARVGKARARGRGAKAPVERDFLVTLGQVSASEIEAGLTLDVLTGKVDAKVEAGLIEVTDNNLLRSLGSTPASDGVNPGRKGNTRQPQVVSLGPVGFGVRGTCKSMTVPETDTPKTKQRHAFGLELVGPPVGAVDCSSSPRPRQTTPALDSQDPSGGGERNASCHDGEARERFRNACGSVWRWDWKGRVRLGAHSAELGDCHWQETMMSHEVWRRLRFVLPSRPSVWRLDESQVLRGGAADDSGEAESSYWLYRAGGRRLTVDVQVPKGGARDIPRSSSPTCHLYVSSDDSDADNPTATPTADSHNGHHSSPWTRRRRSSNPKQAASEFPSTITADSFTVDAAPALAHRAAKDNHQGQTDRRSTQDQPTNRHDDSQEPTALERPRMTRNLVTGECDSSQEEDRDDGHGSDCRAEGAGVFAAAASGFGDVADVDDDGPGGLLSIAALMRRVRELEEEVLELRQAARAAGAATALATDMLGGGGGGGGGGDDDATIIGLVKVGKPRC